MCGWSVLSKWDCVDSCAAISCPLNQSCQDGVCVDDPCFNVSCPADSPCTNGMCIADCMDCSTGQICIGGVCSDDPCNLIECPTGQSCRVDSSGRAQCVGGWERATTWVSETDDDDDGADDSDAGGMSGSSDNSDAEQTLSMGATASSEYSWCRCACC